MSVQTDVIALLLETLSLPEGQLDGSSALIGAIPEFDSMAVVSILTAIEEQYGIMIDDDEIDGEIFESVTNLVDFVSAKV